MNEREEIYFPETIIEPKDDSQVLMIATYRKHKADRAIWSKKHERSLKPIVRWHQDGRAENRINMKVFMRPAYITSPPFRYYPPMVANIESPVTLCDPPYAPSLWERFTNWMF